MLERISAGLIKNSHIADVPSHQSVTRSLVSLAIAEISSADLSGVSLKSFYGATNLKCPYRWSQRLNFALVVCVVFFF